MTEGKAMADSKQDNAAGNDEPMRIDSALVRELAELLTSSGLTEIEVEDGDRKIKVCRSPAPIIAATPFAQPSSGAMPQISPPGSDADADEAGDAVKSPMVGTVFLSPEPGADNFISVGDTVKPGDTLMIVEAMKVMNPITAPSGGVVKKVLVSDAQPVEFDQPLVILA